jgi:ppGpp synthetase/RelA/SpoT-type nucleotidyltranferase
MVLENWRASHTHVINTFQATLRAKTRDKKIIVAQRLKRRPTIENKLVREPSMQLDTMHDIAGCRLIFSTIRELKLFRAEFHKSKFKHIRKNPEKYDYITTPKKSGYRGMHDVYEYVGKDSKEWDGLMIEIQYRTLNQHAWATAVEVAGAITGNHSKFNQGSEDQKTFFRLCSEIIARAHEKMHSCFSELSNDELVDLFWKLEKKISLLKTLRDLKKINQTFLNKKAVILIRSDNTDNLEIVSFRYKDDAVSRYMELEKERPNANIVLVMANSAENLISAYRNYFLDATDFVNLVETGLQIIAK